MIGLEVALGIKLTAIVVVPAMLAEMALSQYANRQSDWRRALIQSTALWTTTVLLAFVMILALWGNGSLQTSWKSHFSSQPVVGIGQPNDYGFEPKLLMGHAECAIAAVVGRVLIARQKRWREFAFPLVLLFLGCVRAGTPG